MSLEHLVVNVLIAMGIAASPAVAADARFEVLGVTDQFSVEIDLNSVEITEPNGFQINATMKRVMKQPVIVQGKKKPGSYYIETTRVRCEQNDLTFLKSTLFSTDGEILVSGDINKIYPNTNVKGSFIADYIEITCNTAKKSKPANTV